MSELAWRLDAAGRYGPPRRWLVVTGTNGKTTTTSMLYDMLTSPTAVGPCCAATSAIRCSTCWRSPRMLAVEVSSFQLFLGSVTAARRRCGANVAEDHLDWHGTFEAYAAAWRRALDGRVAVAGLDDPAAAAAAPGGGPVKVGFRLGEPTAGEWVCDGALIDRAFADGLDAGRGRRHPGGRTGGVLDALPPPRWPARSMCLASGHRGTDRFPGGGTAPNRSA